MNTERTQPTRPQAAGLAPGDRLDKYQIIEQIGAGGMSVVWKGYDRLIDQHVAIKQIMPDVASEGLDELHERFRREAELQKRVSRQSRHIVTVIDLIDEPRGMFIIMEYIDGPTLEQLIAEDLSPMEPRRAMGIIGAVTLALQSMHEQGVVHRDLKPSNVLMPRGGGLKVTDFGLAAVLEDQEALSIGSVRYMAPELFQGGPVDGRADIYSLGMMAFELLAGRRQFDEAFKIVLRDQRNQSLRWMKWHTNPRAKVQPLHNINPNVPETLSDLVSRMMEKDPTQRIASASQLLEAMRRHFAQVPMSPGPILPKRPAATTAAMDITAPTAAVPAPSRWPMVLAAVLLVQLVIAGGIFLHRASVRRADAEHRIADAKQTYAQAEASYGKGQFRGAATLFEQLSRDMAGNMIGKRAASYAELAAARIDMLENRYADAREKFYHVRDANLLPPQSGQILQLIDEADKRISFDDQVAKIRADIQEGRVSDARQKLDRQSTYTHTAEEDQVLIELEGQIGGQLNQKRIGQELATADALKIEGKADAAIAALKRAREKYPSPKIDEKIAQLQREKQNREAMSRADQAERADNFDAAIAALKDAAAVQDSDEIQTRIRKLKGQQLYSQAKAKETGGEVATAQSLYTQAAGYGHAEAQQAIDRLKTSNQRDAYVRAGDSAMANTEFETAITQYENALRISEDSTIRDRLTNAKVRLELDKGQQLLKQGDTAGARDAFDRAKKLSPANQEASKGLTDISVRMQYMKLLADGDDLRAKGKFAQAKETYRKAKDVMATDDVQQRLNDTEYDHLLANVRFYAQKGEWTTASAWLKSAAKIRDSEDLRTLAAEIAKHVKTDEQK